LLGNNINKLSKRPFALPNLFFRPLSVRDIANGGGNQHAFFGFQGAEADLHRKLMPIFTQAVKFQPGTHRSHVRVGKESRPVPGMLTPEPLRHQHFDFLP
jgi:hypothetical protein